jgi:hypothetical protein
MKYNFSLVDFHIHNLYFVKFDEGFEAGEEVWLIDD